MRDLVTNLSSEVAELRQQNEDLFKIQQRILYIFSRYMRATQGGATQGVGGSQAAGIGGQRDDGGGSGTKRIRGRESSDGAKRQRLLMAGRPDSPHDASAPQPYHADNYSSSPGATSRANSDYFPSAAAGGSRGGHSSAAAGGQQNGPHVTSPSESGGVVDLNTDQYHSNPNYSGGFGNMDPSGYGSHSLSDLNWSTDPVAAINDLITKMPSHAQSVLNTSMNSMPMQMGRGAGSNPTQQMMQGQPFMVDQAGFGYQGRDAEHYGSSGLPLLPAPTRRGGNSAAAGAGSNQHLLDLSSQLASSNPKQLLQMLDRMGADQGAMGGAGSALGSARKLMQGRGGAGDDALYSMADDQSSSNQAISGVFEDANDLLAAAPSVTAAASKATKGKAKKSSTKSSSKTAAAAAAADIPAAAAATKTSSSRSRRPAPAVNVPASPAKLSPIDDIPTSFTLNKDPSAAIPLLNSLPLPTSPISPFGDTGTNLVPPQDAYAQQAQMQQQQMQQQVQQQPASSVGYSDMPMSLHLSLLHSPAPPLGHSLGMPDLNRDSSLTMGLGSDHSGLMRGSSGTGGAGGYAAGAHTSGGPGGAMGGSGMLPPSPYLSGMAVGSGAQQVDNLMPLTPNLTAPLSPSPFR